MNINEFVLKAMAVPFKEKGRDYEGVDCYGIAYLGFKEVFNIQLPTYTDDYSCRGPLLIRYRIIAQRFSLSKRKKPFPEKFAERTDVLTPSPA